jgi:hypothetical protein
MTRARRRRRECSRAPTPFPLAQGEAFVNFLVWRVSGARELSGMRLLAYNLLRWQIFSLAILRDTDDTRGKLFVEYERVIAAPREEPARICEFLDRECHRSSGGRVDEMAAVVRSEERHHQGRSFEQQEPVATQEQRALF